MLNSVESKVGYPLHLTYARTLPCKVVRGKSVKNSVISCYC